jgi:hypothetical protein
MKGISTIISLVVGFGLGLFGEPIKKWISEKLERQRAKRELYDDLGAYLARVEAFRLLSEPDPILWIEITRPNVPFFDYYNEKNPAIFLRTDKTHGVRNLVRVLRGLGNAYRPENGTPESLEPFRLRTFPDDVIKRYDELLGSKTLDRKALHKAYKHHRQPIAKNTPPLIAPSGFAHKAGERERCLPGRRTLR